MTETSGFRAGFVAVLGRPNVGKSTLVNALVGARVAIVSRRPQTTRRRILGVVNRPQAQLVLVDTPGLHLTGGRALNRALNASARRAVADADAVLLVVEAGRWTEEDERALVLAKDSGHPVVLALNKVDRIRPRAALLPMIAEASRRHEFSAVVPVSAVRHENIERIPVALLPLLPASPQLFPLDQITDQGAAERAAEMVREALIERLGAELPYTTFVTIERWEEGKDTGRVDVDAVIWVARESQKGIVIGAGGRTAKAIGSAARLAIERDLGRRVMLRLWVRVRPDWNRNPRLLGEMGFGQ